MRRSRFLHVMDSGVSLAALADDKVGALDRQGCCGRVIRRDRVLCIGRVDYGVIDNSLPRRAQLNLGRQH